MVCKPLPPPTRPPLAALTLLACAAALWSGCSGREPAAGAGSPAPGPRAPERLAETGLYADFAARTLADGVLPFAPQYPLWTDGAAKRRWISLPAGSAIDASEVDDWDFPIGTRLWKEFAFERAVETRFMKRLPDGSWLYATYAWTEDGSDARLAPERGVLRAAATAEGKHHDIPSLTDCRLCHENGRSPVLGFSALQLSPDRDPQAPHATPHSEGELDLNTLVARGLLKNLPQRWSASPPRIDARSATERTALGYLHGNCSSCHNAEGPLQRLGMRLDYSLADQTLASDGPAPAVATTVGVPSQFVCGDRKLRIAPGSPSTSVLVQRIASSNALTQMPPFARHLVDTKALELIEQWVRELPAATVPLTSLPPKRTKEK